MSDYFINSVKLSALVNASVDANVECLNDSDEGYIDDMTNGDYVRFFILLSDINKNIEFEIASFQTKDLGCDDGPITVLSDTYIDVIRESALAYYLTEVLKYDYYNFTLTVGIGIWCEDNILGDNDYFNDLYLKDLNLTIDYEKDIDQFTTLSLNQVSNKLKGNQNQEIKTAKLNFDYRIDSPWPKNSSLAEMRIILNNKVYVEKTILLISIQDEFNNLNGDQDVRNYIQFNENVSISIELFLKDDITLNETKTIFIDNLTLYIQIGLINTGFNWIPVIFGLIGGIISVSGITIVYQTYWRYPPIVRKNRKLKKKIKKSKKIDRKLDVHQKSNMIDIILQRKKEILNIQEVEEGGNI
jgi:hypothetical protein